MRYEAVMNFNNDEIIQILCKHFKEESGKNYIIRKTDTGYTAVEDISNQSIKIKDVLDRLDTRTRNCLWVEFNDRHDEPVSFLLSTTPFQLKGRRNFGKKCYQNLIQVLSSLIGNYLSYPVCSDCIVPENEKVFK